MSAIEQRYYRVEEHFELAEQLDHKTEKFRYYRSLPSFREYLMINAEKPAVDAFYRKEENLSRISSATGLVGYIHLYSIDAGILLEDIDAKTKGLPTA